MTAAAMGSALLLMGRENDEPNNRNESNSACPRSQGNEATCKKLLCTPEAAAIDWGPLDPGPCNSLSFGGNIPAGWLLGSLAWQLQQA